MVLPLLPLLGLAGAPLASDLLTGATSGSSPLVKGLVQTGTSLAQPILTNAILGGLKGAFGQSEAEKRANELIKNRAQGLGPSAASQNAALVASRISGQQRALAAAQGGSNPVGALRQAFTASSRANAQGQAGAAAAKAQEQAQAQAQLAQQGNRQTNFDRQFSGGALGAVAGAAANAIGGLPLGGALAGLFGTSQEEEQPSAEEIASSLPIPSGTPSARPLQQTLPIPGLQQHVPLPGPAPGGSQTAVELGINTGLTPEMLAELATAGPSSGPSAEPSAQVPTQVDQNFIQPNLNLPFPQIPPGFDPRNPFNTFGR